MFAMDFSGKTGFNSVLCSMKAVENIIAFKALVIVAAVMIET